MHPYLIDFTLNGYELRMPTYGIFLALALTCAYLEGGRRAKQLGEGTLHLDHLFILTVLSALVGSRLFHVFIEDPKYYRANSLLAFKIWEGGYTYYIAKPIALLAVLFYANKHRLNLLQYGDIAAPATALGLGVARLGCFMAGCCYGTPTSLPWGCVFKNLEAAVPDHTVALHPTQLYEGTAALAIFAYATWRFRRRKYIGQIALHTLLLYWIARFGIEFFRGDHKMRFIDGIFSSSQLVALACIPITVLGILLFSRKPEGGR